MRTAVRLLFLAFLLPLSQSVIGQNWPARPVRIVVPYPPGGLADVIARYVSQQIAPALGQPVIADNKPGAQGIVGLEIVKNAPADGYTFGYAVMPAIAINPHLYPKLPYDSARDFAPVTQLGLASLGMVVPASLKVKNVPDFIAYVRANPGKVSYASFGSGSTSHIYAEMLNLSAGTDMVHVPYKGAAPAVQDILAGQAQMGIHDFTAITPHVRSGRLVLLAVIGEKRWPAFPDTPTFAEQGLPLDMSGWNGIVAPAKTPRPIVERMSAEMARAVQTLEGRERTLAMGLLATGTTPDAFAEIIRRDTQRWGEVIRKSKIKAD